MMIRKDLTGLRQEYAAASLYEHTVHSNPFIQFASWLDQAIMAELPEPNAMTLASTGRDGKPHARVVLLKELDEQGFVFYTNYNSNKGKELKSNPHAALVFLWLELQRQVRVEGLAEKVAENDSDAYFASRPVSSQLGAIASPQSTVIPSRDYLEKQFETIKKDLSGKTIMRPDHWGGYRLIPDRFEFWQGRENRLHDRLLYVAGTDGWNISRLAP
jgi:pyridoxamine 5'-phosphate oxidase